MLAYLILGIALLAGVLLMGQWYVQADPKSILRVLKWVLVGTIVAVALFFLWTGRIVWAMAAIPALLPWFFRFRQAARAAKAFHRMGSGPSGQASTISTRFLDMTLDHGSGDIDGSVREGAHAGRRLGELSDGDLRTLLDECAADPDSQRLLQSYLDRNRPGWREEWGGGGASGHQTADDTTRGAMGRDEALAVLGLDADATDDDVREAHRRLIANLHPDRGGSDYLAAQINRAKDTLLG